VEVRRNQNEKKEIIKGRPVRYCPDCGRKKWSCRCYKEERRDAQRRMLPLRQDQR